MSGSRKEGSDDVLEDGVPESRVNRLWMMLLTIFEDLE